MIDEVEESLVGPVKILEHQHERSLFGQSFEEASPRRERLIAQRHRVLASEADEAAHVTQDPVDVARVGQGLLHHRRELRARIGIGVGLEDPRLCLHYLGQRPEADAVAIGKGAAMTPVDELRR